QRPVLHPPRRPQPPPQQELPQPVPCTQLVLFGRLPRPHQVPQRLVRRVRHPHRRQVTAAVAPRQLFRVPPVRLYPIPRLHRHQRRRHHVAVHSQSRQLPVKTVPVRPRLVTDP